MTTQSNSNLSRTQSSSLLNSAMHKMMMSSSDLLPRRRALPKDDSPEERSAFVIGILDEVLDILNDDIFDDDLLLDAK
ncbi:unnamed protein product [Cylindrotheca closterium]|uniref:Uncharacterized protein n=1 Tax=Cylindrotheca closterium TaxID=2856 RepID=A0AAD2G2V6_9STRA|nr:unnamed protein product [Cylindrotheca closterium]